MSRIVLLIEEYSMKVLLDSLLPRLFPNLEFLCVPHEGKNDLERSIPRKLRAWREPGVRFVPQRHERAPGTARSGRYQLGASALVRLARRRVEERLAALARDTGTS